METLNFSPLFTKKKTTTKNKSMRNKTNLQSLDRNLMFVLLYQVGLAAIICRLDQLLKPSASVPIFL